MRGDVIREKRVTRFICSFCSRGRSKRSVAEAHVRWCSHNPANKSCRSCEHYCPAERPEYDRGHHYPGALACCAEGISFAEGLPRGCEQWASR